MHNRGKAIRGRVHMTGFKGQGPDHGSGSGGIAGGAGYRGYRRT
jgi:hypothetical protein